jgi:2,3-bisphosphoglycerate-independent phosphoglycerate mutase
MDRIAREGTLGLIDTIPPEYPPGSDVATLSVLGYDPVICYSGRGPLEAASMGIHLECGDIAFRCNLVTLGPETDPVMADYTAGHITTAEAGLVMADLQRELGSEQFIFHPGVGYRHLLIWRGGASALVATPPHDITGKAVTAYAPRGEGADEICRLIRRSRRILPDHPVNRARLDAGKRPANAIWPWGQGKAPDIAPLTGKYGLRGVMISAVDLLNGIGVYAGLNILRVQGATGYTDTNYVGKARRALAALEDVDFVFVHVEAPDEMGHEGNREGKIRAIEDFDELVVGTVLAGIDRFAPFRVMVLCDHPTPLSLKTHASDPSPFAVLSSQSAENTGLAANFGEAEARRGKVNFSPGYRLMDAFIRDWGKVGAQGVR